MTNQANQAHSVAKLLIEAGCLKLSPEKPFTYASGLKGPMYCDNRLLLSDPVRRGKVLEVFGEVLSHLETPDAFVGVATAGIPHAAFLALQKELPLLYIRSEAKGHGRQNRLEGNPAGIKKTVLVEDLVNQGGSLAQAITGVQEAELEVIYCLSIVDYQMKQSRTLFEELQVNVHSLTNLTAIIEYGQKAGLIDEAGASSIKRWQTDPAGWS